VLHAAHLHHGLRGEEADGDLAFAHALASELGLSFHEARIDVAVAAKERGETIEEAARRLRYGWFRQLMGSGEIEAVATAHTRDDQAETVLAKFLRGAWTEGLGGIHPVVAYPEGRILRPLLSATRAEVEAYLAALGQSWREDSSNRHLTFTRNRIRHELLPLLEGWNPRLREHLAQMAELARDEEAWWQVEVARVAPQLLLPGRPVRGGGRAADDGLALDVTRLAQLALALQRRLLRSAAEQLGAKIDLSATEVLRALALSGKAGQRRELALGLRAERSHRELRLRLAVAVEEQQVNPAIEFTVAIPGEVTGFGVRLQIEVLAEDGQKLREAAEMHPSGAKAHSDLEAKSARLKSCPFKAETDSFERTATLRNWRPGDRVRLRHSSGPRKVKEVLERLRVSGSGRALWPVLEVDGRIIWMRGVEVEPPTEITVVGTLLEEA
jgi:tRNA(Ile)-lysidine synthase